MNFHVYNNNKNIYITLLFEITQNADLMKYNEYITHKIYNNRYMINCMNAENNFRDVVINILYKTYNYTKY